MNIIFDLDGTLIDSSERMYQLFCELIPQCKLTKEEYWNYKRNKVDHEKLLKEVSPGTDFDQFNEEWLRCIERKKFLDMDVVYQDTLNVLEELKAEYGLYLLTARQSKSSLYDELKKLKLFDYFREILVTEGNMTKERLLYNAIKRIPDLKDKSNVLVSDMGKDIVMGNKMGYITVAITHGFMCREKLKEYGPKKIIDQLNELRL